MSLKSVLALVDKKLKDAFDTKTPNASRERAKALKTIETAKKQYAATEPARGRKAFAVGGGDVISFTPGYEIEPGEPTVYVPASRFNDFLDGLKGAIEAGELDKALLAKSAEPVAAGAAVAIEPKKRGGPKGKRGPLSPEALAARRAKVAAKAGK